MTTDEGESDPSGLGAPGLGIETAAAGTSDGEPAAPPAAQRDAADLHGENLHGEDPTGPEEVDWEGGEWDEEYWEEDGAEETGEGRDSEGGDSEGRDSEGGFGESGFGEAEGWEVGAALRPRWWVGRSRGWWALRLSLLGLLIVVDVAAVLLVLVFVNQPVEYAGVTPASFPGLPSAKGVRRVNDFGGLEGQLYLPPQSKTFSLSTSIVNSGSHGVELLAVNLEGPGGTRQWPLVAVGPAHFRVLGGPRYYVTWTLGKGTQLPAGLALQVSLPVRPAYPCYSVRSWTGVDEMWLETEWLGVHHWVAVPMTPILLHDPEPPNPVKVRGLPAIRCPS